MTTKTNPRLKIESSLGTARPRHFVKLDKQGNPTDTALCGFIWDRLHVQHNGAMCQECVDEMRKQQ